MNFDNLNTYSDSHQRAFEILCNQLFERWIRKECSTQIEYFSTVNGAGGDGGVEAYCKLKSGEIVGVQSKWFRTSLSSNQISQIKNSITTAKTVRRNLKRYIVCLPRDFQSEKIGKGNKIVEDCEEKKINSLIEEIEGLHNDLELEFWNEHRIRIELQKSGNEGISRFWFQKEEVSIEILSQRFELAKSGWLKERYVPSLHSQGKIQKIAEELLSTPKFRQTLSKRIQIELEETERTCSLIDEFNLLSKTDNEFESQLNSIKDNLESYIQQLSLLKTGIEIAAVSITKKEIKEIDIWPTRVAIEKKDLATNFRNLKPKLIGALEKTHKANLPLYDSYIDEYFTAHNCIVLGRPGSGKTHGVAKIVESRLSQNYPALIIRAKDSACDSWASILQNYLGGLVNWTDLEIFSALEALARRTDAARASGLVTGDVANEQTRVLICVDGIDEATDLHSWRIRINETTQWIKVFPSLRFIVTSRSYGLPNVNPAKLEFDENVNRRFDLPMDGDVPLSELVPKYFEEFKIKYENSPWIVDVFENALTLRLFCEEYKEKDISSELSVSYGLSALINLKLSRIEEEFSKKFPSGWSKTDQVIKKSLFHIAESLNSKSSVKHDELCSYLVKEFDGLLDRNQAARLLDTFTDHGILLRKEVINPGPLVVAEYIYVAAFQSYIDFFISVKATQEIVRDGIKEFPVTLKSTSDWNPVRLTAISLLTDHGILVGLNDYWKDDLDEVYLQELQFEALSKSSVEQIRKYLPELKRKFFQSNETRNIFLEHFLLPNLHRDDLKLGREFIHDLLINFPNTFERDLAWSSPDHFARKDDGDFEVCDILENKRLFDFHKHDQLPLVIAWSFASVNNVYREKARTRLAEWATKNTKEFVLLLDLVFFCGDGQIQEDLSIVMLGVASEVGQSGTEFGFLVKWVVENVFADSKIIGVKNSIVRHCCRSVVERGFALDECSDQTLKRARPPYKTDPGLLAMDISGATGSRGERYPIVHDLAWYVIEKSYDGFMGYVSGRKTHDKAEALLQQYRNIHGQDFGPLEFAMSVAIAFIKKLGWNRQNGPSWTEASHGSRSKQATFEEKYTWLAVREIQGYLADRLPFYNDNEEYEMLLDYNLLLHVANPIARNTTRDFSEILEDKWYLPEDLSPILVKTGNLKDDIKKWVNRKDVPNFQDWIFIKGLKLKDHLRSNGNWTALYSFSQFEEPNKICEASIEMICCLISKKQFHPFLKYFKDNLKEHKFRFFDRIDHFTASPRTDTYSSVKDVLWMNWMEEDYSTFSLWENEEIEYEIKKLVTSVTENSIGGRELHSKMPSKFLRNELKIVAGNTAIFLNKEGTLKALYYNTGHPIKDMQELLLVNAEGFDSIIEGNGLMPFWIARQFQTTTVGHKKVDLEDHHQNSRFWIVWQEGLSFKNYLFHDGYFSNQDDPKDDS